MKIIVLGAGLIGAPMSIDLAKESNFEVTAVDISDKALAGLSKTYPIKTRLDDLSKPNTVKKLVQDFDLVLSAVPGSIGFNTLKAVIEAKKNVVDIAFFPEDPFLLDDIALRNAVTAVVDCGVAPGMANVFIGHIDNLLDEIEKVITYVGGLPEIREWPYEYKAVFSPYDVIEEYIRPSRYVENGKLVVKPALSEPELMHFNGVGTLEAFNTDGLRTLAKTISAPNMKEKTLRYPGHIEKMTLLRETGFFNKEEIAVNGTKVSPLDVTAKLLFPKWKLNPEDRDITVLKLIIEGKKKDKKIRYVYDLLDRYNTASNTSSMARTTGYTATTAIRMIAKGLYTPTGISAPEFIGRDSKCVKFMRRGLEERGVFYKETIEAI